VAAVVLGPLYLLLMVSVAPGAAVFGERPALWVGEPTLRFWRRVVERGDLVAPALRSLAVATATAAAALAVAAPAAYALARLPPRVRYTALLLLLGARLMPEFLVGVSVASRFAALGLTDRAAGLVLAHLVPALPLAAFVLTGVFRGIPRELWEAAAVDGASPRQALARVIVPAAGPGLAATALLVWLLSWNEFLYARLLTTAEPTLPLQVFQAVDRGARQQMAAVAATLVPPVVVAVALAQRHLRAGALAGALKG
jgi:ABC-type glycerol-3-phosphate transport system permease component